MAGGRAGSFRDEVDERDVEGVGDQQEVSEAGIALASFVPLDGASLYADAVGELVLGEAGHAAGGDQAGAQFPAPGGDPLGKGGSSEGHVQTVASK